MTDEQHFRHCWLTVKNSKPRWRKFMDQVEFAVEGAGRVVEKKQEPKQDSEDDNANRNQVDHSIVV